MQGRNQTSLYPLGEGIHCNEKESVPVGVLGKWSSCVNTPAEEGCHSLVNPAQLLQRWWRHSVLLLCNAAMHTVTYVFMHARPPELLTDFAEQLVTATMSQVLVDVRKQLCSAHQWRNTNPTLLPMPSSRQ